VNTIDYENLVIVVEKDIPRKKRRGANPADDPRSAQLKAMDVGDSFFIAGGARKDCRSVINLAKKLNIHLLARDVEVDDIYQAKGVRVWRIDESEVRTRGTKGVLPPTPKPEVDDDDF